MRTSTVFKALLAVSAVTPLLCQAESTFNNGGGSPATATILAAPALADAATTTITLTAVGKIVQQDAKWAYGYANDFIPPAGTYGGVNANNSRVTYTASVP